PGALAEYRRTREIAERGAAQANAESHHASFRANVVNARAVAGDLLRRIGDPDEALREYRLALAAAKTNVEQHSDNFSGPDQVWWIGVKIGDLLADQGDTHGALTAYREALDAGNRMDDFHRNSSSWQRNAIEIQ